MKPILARFSRAARARRLTVARLLLALAGIGLTPLGQAYQVPVQNDEASSASAVAQPLRPDPAFAALPAYSGTLGTRRILLHLGTKTDDPSGVHGEYQFADSGETILIAGERDGTTLEAEESNDGTHITGNWVGTFAADGSLTGTRMNPDDSEPEPFVLQPVKAGAAAAVGARPVSGVSNLSTGE
ncbi:hypothetical protein [Paraburkholderia hayleyella]|uniref:hypothetical protein n=1 Tax=Paraburkholderia hayleyella TaxID=2152889 RepID=UPI001FE6DE65|nr:hypothetical protein [Paraburkholderia hayleyella]